MDQSRFIRGLLDDPADPQQPQYVPANDFGPRAYGLLNTLFPDPNVMVGDAIKQYRGGDAVGAFETMFGAIPATGALRAAPKAAGIIAYHGSPHSFDKFDLSKIGTGEGAQAYGHGLYFAESEPVAQMYRDNLSRRNIEATIDGRSIEKWPETVDEVSKDNWRLGKLLDEYGRVGGKYEDFVRQQKDWYRGQPEMESALDEFEKRVAAQHHPGSMYQVRINADPNAFLDWDRPFANADEVERFAAKFDNFDPGIRKKIEDWGYTRQQSGQPMPDGNDIMREVFGGVDGPKGREATRTMQQAGIPGIKYLDQGSRPNVGHVDMLRQQLATLKSRSASQAAIDNTQRALDEAEKSISRNYVVFDDSLIDILKKYGLIGLLGGGAAASGVSGMNTQPSMSNSAPGL